MRVKISYDSLDSIKIKIGALSDIVWGFTGDASEETYFGLGMILHGFYMEIENLLEESKKSPEELEAWEAIKELPPSEIANLAQHIVKELPV
jgi:hypothetical protein